MYEILVEYVDNRKAVAGDWDGNVPANFRTTLHSPPRPLGRWVNRQRSAHQKLKLKAEWFEKLSSIGLKWSIQEHHQPLPVALTQQDTYLRSNLSYGVAVASESTAPPIASVAPATSKKGSRTALVSAAAVVPLTSCCFILLLVYGVLALVLHRKHLTHYF